MATQNRPGQSDRPVHTLYYTSVSLIRNLLEYLQQPGSDEFYDQLVDYRVQLRLWGHDYEIEHRLDDKLTGDALMQATFVSLFYDLNTTLMSCMPSAAVFICRANVTASTHRCYQASF